MKLKDLLQNHYDPKEKFKPHSKNDILSDMKKILTGAHFSTLDLKCISTDNQLEKGLMIFKDKRNKYKIDYRGKIYLNDKEIEEVRASSDLHSQYSNAIHKLIKWIENNEA